MPISTYYATTVSTKRLLPVGATDKETFQLNIPELFCRIEQQGEEPVMMGDGAYYYLFKMWCKNADVKTGDQIISDSTYIVKGVSKFKRVTESVHHLEILLALPK